MNKKNCLMALLIIIINLVIFNIALADETCANGEEPPCDEQATFISVAPDLLFLLDFSGSMDWNPAGGTRIYGTSSCAPDTTKCCTSTDPQENGYCSSSKTGCSTYCSRLAILKRAVFNILDDNNDNVIDAKDQDSLNVRIGYMRYHDGDDTAGNYNSGYVRVVRGIGSAYYQMFCGKTGSTSSCSPVGSNSSGYNCTSGECISGQDANGGTPLASAFREAKTYLDYHKSQDNAKACRQKFVIVLTDGSDTYACGAGGGECDSGSYKRRRESVKAVKALKDAGYRVFVIGFGSSMPTYLQNTLNWMAFYGGTDNPLLANSGSTGAYNPDSNTSCQTETLFYSGSCQGDNYNNWFARNNDPGYISLSGYAFLAGDSDTLTKALKSAMQTIREAVYSFSQASVQAVRTQSENFLYEASFEPVNNEYFWIGHLKKYKILTALEGCEGCIDSSSQWDAGTKLANETTANERNIFTLKGNIKTPFNTSLLKEDLAADDDADKEMIVNFIRGGETSPAVTNWKLGDIFHSFPITVGTPSLYYIDKVDKFLRACTYPVNAYQRCNAYDLFRESHPRPSADGKRIITVGANDGQLHAFKTVNGKESWSFIPPNFLQKLKLIAHPAHPTDLIVGDHYSFVDGFTSYDEVWLGTGNGASKIKDDWHTLMVVGEGRGAMTNLWSKSPDCNSQFSINNHYVIINNPDPPDYYRNYCGYYAFDLTDDTETPLFQWRIGSNTALSDIEAQHLGQPWGKMTMHRVYKDGNEKWVGFIGGGYSGNDCTGTGCDTSGKGFYVIDLMNGDVLRSYTKNDNGSMAYDLVANPAVIDYDNDGVADTVYIGDRGGNVWRFKFPCKQDQTSCGKNQWVGEMLFSGVGIRRPIYNMTAVTRDTDGNIWIHFGTGEKTDPTFIPADGTQERFFAVIDKNIKDPGANPLPFTSSSLKDITGGTFNASDFNNYKGFMVRFTTPGEKVLGETTVYQGVIFFTTYVPGSATNPCDQTGKAYLYAINYLTGAGVLPGDAKKEEIGSGIPSTPIVSVGPSGTASVYVSTSAGGGATGAATQKREKGTGQIKCPVQPCPNDTRGGGSIFYWRDLRLP